MAAILENPAYLWLACGALLVAAEALTAPGLGIFLAGLGAICTGLLVEAGIVQENATALQFACFFGLTTVWALLLWRPLVKFRTSAKGKKSGEYSDIVGTVAVVAGERGLKRGETGQVSWSGTLMNAELDDSAKTDSLPVGAHVKVLSVSGNTFKVTPK